MTCAETLFLNPGSDYAQTAVAYDQDGAVLNLTGYTATAADLTGVLSGAVAASIPDAAAGEVRIELTWDASWPLTPGDLGTFRLTLVSGGTEHASFPVTVTVPLALDTVSAPRGGDLVYSGTWPDDSEGADFTGQTLEVVNASATLSPLVSVAVTDAAERVYTVTIEGSLAVALGDAGTFQLRRSTAGVNRRTSPPMGVTFR